MSVEHRREGTVAEPRVRIGSERCNAPSQVCCALVIVARIALSLPEMAFCEHLKCRIVECASELDATSPDLNGLIRATEMMRALQVKARALTKRAGNLHSISHGLSPVRGVIDYETFAKIHDGRDRQGLT